MNTDQIKKKNTSVDSLWYEGCRYHHFPLMLWW